MTEQGARAVAYGQSDVYYTGPLIASIRQVGSRIKGTKTECKLICCEPQLCAFISSCIDADTLLATFVQVGRNGITLRSADNFEVLVLFLFCFAFLLTHAHALLCHFIGQ